MLEIEEKKLLHDLHRALLQVDIRYAYEEAVFPTLDEACRHWLAYRYRMLEHDPSVDTLELSVGASNALHNADVRTISQLRKIRKDVFAKISDEYARKYRKEIREVLAEWDEEQARKKRKTKR